MLVVLAILAGITVMCAISCTGIVIYTLISNWISDKRMHEFLKEELEKSHKPFISFSPEIVSKMHSERE